MPKCNLIVCGLSSQCTDRDLLEIFTPFGEILSSKVMIDMATGVHRGFGFVLFKESEAAAAAKEKLHGTIIDRSRLHIDFAQHDAFNVVTDTPKIFVRNIPLSATTTEVHDYFAQYGNILVCMLRGEHGKRPGASMTNNAFIEFSETADAKTAVEKSSGSTPFGNSTLPIMTKFAETPDVRVERRQRQRLKQRDAQPSAPQTGVPPSLNIALPSQQLGGGAPPSLMVPMSLQQPTMQENLPMQMSGFAMPTLATPQNTQQNPQQLFLAQSHPAARPGGIQIPNLQQPRQQQPQLVVLSQGGAAVMPQQPQQPQMPQQLTQMQQIQLQQMQLQQMQMNLQMQGMQGMGGMQLGGMQGIPQLQQMPQMQPGTVLVPVDDRMNISLGSGQNGLSFSSASVLPQK